MLWMNLMLVVVFALLLGSMLTLGFGWRHPAGGDSAGASLLFLVLILGLAMWAAGPWLPAWGPLFYGSSWLGLLVVGVLVSLLFLALFSPPPPPRTPLEARIEAEEAAAASTAFGLFFWLLLVGLLIIALVGNLG